MIFYKMLIMWYLFYLKNIYTINQINHKFGFYYTYLIKLATSIAVYIAPVTLDEPYAISPHIHSPCSPLIFTP